VLTFFEAWGASLSYTFQLYYDFSGYADMAIGSALLFNIRLPYNFNSPYKATSIQDFWRCWHITLSRWLRNYIYIPLGGNRKGKWRTQINVLLTMLLGGLWHGANWTFVVWGGAHGLALAVNRLWNSSGLRMPLFFDWLTTFLFVNFTWVLFRATSFSDAIKVYKGMFGFNGVKISQEFANVFNYLTQTQLFRLEGVVFTSFVSITTLNYLLLFGTLSLVLKNTQEIYLEKQVKFTILHLLFCVFTVFGTYMLSISGKPSEFLYFNF
jgi:alginate O-acetyltransferase complex protein AlgI